MDDERNSGYKNDDYTDIPEQLGNMDYDEEYIPREPDYIDPEWYLREKGLIDPDLEEEMAKIASVGKAAGELAKDTAVSGANSMASKAYDKAFGGNNDDEQEGVNQDESTYSKENDDKPNDSSGEKNGNSEEQNDDSGDSENARKKKNHSKISMQPGYNKAKKLHDKGQEDLKKAEKLKEKANKIGGQAEQARERAKSIRGAASKAAGTPYVGPKLSRSLKKSAKKLEDYADKLEKKSWDMDQKAQKRANMGRLKIKQANEGTHGAFEDSDDDDDDDGLKVMPRTPNTNSVLAMLKNMTVGVFRFLFGTTIGRFILIGAVILIILITKFSADEREYQGKFIDGDDKNVPYVVYDEIVSQVVIVPDANGGCTYAFKNEDGDVISIDEAVDNALKRLEDAGSTALGDIGEDDEERKAFLKLLIEAEIKTQYPDISNSQSGAVSYSGDDYVVCTTASNSAKVLNEKELTDVVKKWDVSEQAKQNVLGVIPDLVKYQDEYGVNALFLIAVTKIESGCGTAWDYIDPSTYNWVSIMGSSPNVYVDRFGTKWCSYSSFSQASEYWFKLISGSAHYFKNGKYTVQQIAPTYCDSNWGNAVCAELDKLYSLAGVKGMEDSGEDISEDENQEDSQDEEVPNSNTEEPLAEGGVQGNIKIQRKYENGEIKEIQYLDEESFNRMITNKDPKVMDYYTLKKASFASVGGSPGSLVGSEDKEKIWNFLIDSGLTEEGAGALMGNLSAESGCTSVRLQGDFSSGYQTSVEYTKKVDSGEVSESDFVNHGPNGGGYGLAQWTDPSRKQKLYNYAKSKQTSIGDLQTQLEYLLSELSTNSYYSDIWNMLTTSTDEYATSTLILTKFENPADQSDNAKRTRYNLGKEIFDKYTGTHEAGSTSTESGKNDNSSRTEVKPNTGNKTENADSKKDEDKTKKDNEDSKNEDSKEEDSKDDDKKEDESEEDKKKVSFDNFLFIGDSRYNGVSSKLSSLGSNVKVCAADSSTQKQWYSVVQNKESSIRTDQGSFNCSWPDDPEKVNGISVMLGVNALSQVDEMKDLLSLLHEQYPNAKIYFNSVYHVGSNYTVINVDDMNAKIDSFNETFKVHCASIEWLQYVDITEGLYENGTLKYQDASGIHISEDGKQLLVDNIKAKISGSSNGSDESKSAVGKESTYALVLPNYTVETYTSVDTYTYQYSKMVSTTSGSTGSASNPNHDNPAPATAENKVTSTFTTSTLDYQGALRDYTLYVDFLWAMLVSGRDKSVVEELAQEAMKSEIVITVYTETKSNTVESESNGPTLTRTNLEGTTAIVDYYSSIRKTTTTTVTHMSKAGTTFADVWFLTYKNDAEDYEEFKSKEKEEIVEKFDDDSDLMKILRYKDRQDTLYSSAYLLERMIEENPRVAHLYDVYTYILAKAMDSESEYEDLKDVVNIGAFDISSFVPIRSGASGVGGLGGSEGSESGDGYSSTFTVGSMTYKNFKQGGGSWAGDSLAGYPNTTVARSGCAISAISVIASGYGIDMTPGEVNAFAKTTSTPDCHDLTLSAIIGKPVTQHTTGDFPQIIIEQLQAGRPCIVRTSAYSSSHYFSILAISEDGSQVYVSDVGGDYIGSDRNGWQPVSFLDRINMEVLTIGE